LGIASGWVYDNYYHTSPKGVIIGAFSGIFLGFYFLAKIMLKGNKNV
tara:strand:+ start:359 stop:499 length:141 start_codon:yes stop_codon:yes gene_type:complete